MSRRASLALLLAATTCAAAACGGPRRATRPPPPPTQPAARPAARPASRPPPVPLAGSEYHEEPEVVGVVHVVRSGETIYRIARAYGVDPNDLLEVNGIADPRQVAVGAELFVPGASRVVAVTPIAPGTAPPPPPAGKPRPPAPSHAEPLDEDPPVRREAARLAWPLPKPIVYGRFGVRNGRRHDGVDLAAPDGTAIGAAADGEVIYTGSQSGYGELVILKHEGNLVTLYAHCSEILVHEGETVHRGQPVARVGQTGRTTGPHLHFEVREGTRPRNPLLFLP